MQYICGFEFIKTSAAMKQILCVFAIIFLICQSTTNGQQVCQREFECWRSTPITDGFLVGSPFGNSSMLPFPRKSSFDSGEKKLFG